MKKILALIIAGIMLVSFCACGSKSADKGSQSSDTQSPDKAFAGNCEVGDYITFGKYEQDNNAENGKEDIEWLVLDKKDGKVLVVSRYGLDARPYHEIDEDVTWETCSLRQWLNTEFMNEAFSAEEKLKIPTVVVSADQNPQENTDPGNDTMDKIFVLSMEEAEKYIYTTEPHCTGTEYAFSQGAREMIDNGIGERCKWWTRTPGEANNKTVFANFSNHTQEYGQEVTSTETAVRPAMWIEW